MEIETTLLKRGVALSEQVYQVVRGMIVSGRMRPGEAVIEATLAARLGVSRTPVREALKRISDEGLVDVFAQNGTFIAPISRKALEEAYVIRTALEAESAVARGRPPDARRLSKRSTTTSPRTNSPSAAGILPRRSGSTTRSIA